MAKKAPQPSVHSSAQSGSTPSDAAYRAALEARPPIERVEENVRAMCARFDIDPDLTPRVRAERLVRAMAREGGIARRISQLRRAQVSRIPGEDDE